MGELASSSIPNLTGGVSQQPAAIRRENQFESQHNAYATLVDGLGPRRPAEHVRWAAAPMDDKVFAHFINRDETEQYCVMIFPGGGLRVVDLITGEARAITAPDGFGYITHANPAKALKAITVADYTFIVNTTVTAKEYTGAVTQDNGKEALINVKQGNYGKTYKIIVNDGVVAEFQTPSGGNSSDSFSIDTVFIATQLINQLTTNLPGWPCERWGSSVWLRHPSGADFSIRTEDGYSGLAMLVAKDEVARFTDLPTEAKPGFMIGVTGDQGVEGDKYYLRFSPPTTSSSGVWKECAAPGIRFGIDWDSMPYTLKRNGDGSFTLENYDWGHRTVGDFYTNPWPSFIGKTIDDVFFVRNRLGLVAGENVICSRSGEFNQFFRRTVTTLLDDDPVDIASTSARIANMRWSIPFNRNVILFAEQGQYEFGAQGVLTPKTGALVPTSEYETSPNARPATTGTSVFFCMEQDGFAQIREYWNDGQSASKVVAFNTTEHVPRYIPAGVYRIAASRSENIVAVLTRGDPKAIYVYNYLGDPSDRVQSSWTRWEIGGELRGAEFVKADLFVLTQREGQTWLEKIPLAAGKKDPGVDYLTFLDRKITEDGLYGNYNAETDTTTVGLPYGATGVRVISRYKAGYVGPILPGQDIEVVGVAADTYVVLKGNHTTTPLYFGFPVATSIKLSTIFPRESAASPGGAKNAITTGRLQVRYLTLVVSKTSYFKVTVKPKGRAAWTKTFNGRVVGDANTIIGKVPLYSGKVRIPIMSRADTTEITITHDSPLPLSILSMEWEGLYSTRVQRV